MSNNKMLIDAAHPEETRVVIVKGQRLEDFDFEAANKQLLKGNIYLAKVTRVEPSLQACFVDFGGNRHGFLAFSEIHPDYYQIPTADREALIEEERKAAEAYEREENERSNRRHRPHKRHEASVAEDATNQDEEHLDQDHSSSEHDNLDTHAQEVESHTSDADEHHDDETNPVESLANEETHNVENLGGDDSSEEMPERPFRRSRRYKIQEVIKRRQIILVQVVKEERGNKGAALTTYLSLAGRYAVLMPNTARGGGISRKINSSADRVRLKEVVQELEVPDGMGVILRTAGASRTTMEIKRDYDYLIRLWDNVREFTLQSMAPALVYEEGSLVKRSIRDIYSKDIDEVVVAGEAAYHEAREFMRMLMPSHVKNIKLYKENKPIFSRYGVEQQLDSMFSTIVKLRSGGYIVMNQTEALVAIDVNSGRSTREHNIEDTALKTNLEAADEIARQLRLRDLAGLVVIDFIDMLDRRNNRAVERRLKDCLRIDRARIQIGSISPFGLLEMSRQRLRAGVLEGSMVICPHCDGGGKVRSTPSAAVSMLRALEEWLIHNTHHNPIVQTRSDIALFLLNNKRRTLAELEDHFGVEIDIEVSPEMNAHTFYVIHKGEPVLNPVPRKEAVMQDNTHEDVQDDISDEEFEDEGNHEHSSNERSENEGNKKRRRRRRRRGPRDREGSENNAEQNDYQNSDNDNRSAQNDDDAPAPKHESVPVHVPVMEAHTDEAPKKTSSRKAPPKGGDSVGQEELPAETQERRARWRDRLSKVISGKAFAPAAENAAPVQVQVEPTNAHESKQADAVEKGEAKATKKPRATKAKTAKAEVEAPVEEKATKAKKAAPAKKSKASEVLSEPSQDDGPKKSGWWQRKSAG